MKKILIALTEWGYCSTPRAYLTGQEMVEALENGLTRWGW